MSRENGKGVHCRWPIIYDIRDTRHSSSSKYYQISVALKTLTIDINRMAGVRWLDYQEAPKCRGEISDDFIV